MVLFTEMGKMNFWVKRKRMNEELKIEFTLNVKFFIFFLSSKIIAFKILILYHKYFFYLIMKFPYRIPFSNPFVIAEFIKRRNKKLKILKRQKHFSQKLNLSAKFLS